MKALINSKFNNRNESYGEEFSILNSQFHKRTSTKKSDLAYTSFLYFLSAISIISWIISLKVLPFGDAFQFLLGAVVLSVNLLVFKWTKL